MSITFNRRRKKTIYVFALKKYIYMEQKPKVYIGICVILWHAHYIHRPTSKSFNLSQYVFLTNHLLVSREPTHI